jgi:hypothetical protein
VSGLKRAWTSSESHGRSLLLKTSSFVLSCLSETFKPVYGRIAKKRTGFIGRFSDFNTMPGTITPSKSTLQAYCFILMFSKEVSILFRNNEKKNLPMDG